MGRHLTRGFGLIEVLIAVAVIAGAALIVSQFITTQSKQQIKVRNASECESTVASLIAKVKQLDNNTVVDSWVPTASQMSPVGDGKGYLEGRMTQPIASSMANGTGQIESTVDPRMASYLVPNETTIANRINNYQLIRSASSLLAMYFNSSTDYCNTPQVLDPDDSDYLSELVSGIDNAEISVQINRTNGCSPWQPIPINVSTTAGSNSQEVFTLKFTARYEDETGTERNCSASASINPGSDLVAPRGQVAVSALGLTASGNILCGNVSRTSFTYTITQSAGFEEIGVQYLCRLDYFAGRYDSATTPNQNYTVSSGWFFCSSPESAINAMVVQGDNLSASNVVVGYLGNDNDAAINSVGFTVDNAAEGSYKLHVKLVDAARNENTIPITSEILLDLTRPTITSIAPDPADAIGPSVNQHLPGYTFQCSNTRRDWEVVIDEAVEVSTTREIHHYYAGTTIQNDIDCNTASNSYEDMNFGNAQWLVDGPKSLSVIVCDACNVALPQAPDREDTFWFVDSNFNHVPQQNALSAGRISNDAGPNDSNPYIITSKYLTQINSQPNSVNFDSIFTEDFHMRNSYSGRNINAAIAPNFPLQNNIKACLPQGYYSYDVMDGCHNTTTPVPGRSVSTTYRYSNTDAGSNICAGGGSPNNTRYCPTFENNAALAAQACVSPEVSCNIIEDGGYCGDRSGGLSTCTFKDTLHRACYQQSCELTNYVPAADGRLSMAIGDQLFSVPLGPWFIGDNGTCQCLIENLVCEPNVLGQPALRYSVAPQGPPDFECPPNAYRSPTAPPASQCYVDVAFNERINPGTSCIITPGVCDGPPPQCTVTDPPCVGCLDNDASGSCKDFNLSIGPRLCCGSNDPDPTATPNPTCNPASTWTWPNPTCQAASSCSSGETPLSELQTQTCATNDCCNVAQTRTCYTGCTTNPTCSHGGNTYAVGQSVNTFSSASVACGGTCSPITSTCTSTSGGSWDIAPGASTCSVDPCPENGVCGLANNESTVNAPTSGLCASGTPSAVSGSGPYSWTCQGTGAGASNDNCSSDRSCLINTDTSWTVGIYRCDIHDAHGSPTVIEHGTNINLMAHLCTGGMFTDVTADGEATFSCNQGSTNQLPGATCSCNAVE